MRNENNNKNGGFSLIELIVVIVILSVISVGLVTLFTDTTSSFLQSESRITQSNSGRIVVEKLSRDIREAMPNSIRVNGSNNCVEFVPILKASRYIDLPTTSPGSRITVFEQDASTEISGLSTTDLFVMVIPLNTNEVYNGFVRHVASVSGFSKLGNNTTEVQISNARFTRDSPAQRIFFVSSPESYCVEGSILNKYGNYGFNLTQPAPTDMGAPTLILDGLTTTLSNGSAIDIFRYSAGTLNRGALLLLNLQLVGRDNERLTLEHEIHVRNFP